MTRYLAPGAYTADFQSLDQLKAAKIPVRALILRYLDGRSVKFVTRAVASTPGSFTTADGSYWADAPDLERATSAENIAGVTNTKYTTPGGVTEQLRGGETLRKMFGPKATVSGSEVVFDGLADWASEIVIYFRAVSASFGGAILFQLGDSAGMKTSGYVSRASDSFGITEFRAAGTSASDTRYARMSLRKLDSVDGSTYWHLAGTDIVVQDINTNVVAGLSPPMGQIERLRFFLANGNFDRGEIWVECIA